MSKDSAYIPLDYALKIGKILIEIGGANAKIILPDSDFLLYLTDDRSRWDIEYRFMGHLGYGGKFRTTYNSWKVDCYSESETPERLKLISRINEELKKLYDKYQAEKVNG